MVTKFATNRFMVTAQRAVIEYLRAELMTYIDEAKLLPGSMLGDIDQAPVWGYTPDDVAEVPCWVVTFPEIESSFEIRTTFDIEQSIFIVGNRTVNEDLQLQLIELADVTVSAFGGSKSLRIMADGIEVQVHVTSCRPRQMSIAEKVWNCYHIQLQSNAATCPPGAPPPPGVFVIGEDEDEQL